MSRAVSQSTALSPNTFAPVLAVFAASRVNKVAVTVHAGPGGRSTGSVAGGGRARVGSGGASGRPGAGWARVPGPRGPAYNVAVCMPCTVLAAVAGVSATVTNVPVAAAGA